MPKTTHIHPDEPVASIHKGHENYGVDLFVDTPVQRSGMLWTFDAAMFAIQCTQAMGELPAVFELLGDLQPFLLCGGCLEVVIYEVALDGIADWLNHVTDGRFGDHKISP